MIDPEKPKILIELFGNTPFTKRLLDHIFHNNGHSTIDDPGIDAFKELIESN